MSEIKRNSQGQYMPVGVDWANAVIRDCVVCQCELEVLPNEEGEVPSEIMCGNCADDYQNRRQND